MKNKLFGKGLQLSDFAGKAASILANGGLLYVLSFFSSIIVARALGTTGQGELSVAVTVCGIGTHFGGLGIDAADKYFIAKKPSLMPKIMGNTVAMLGVYSCIAAVIWAVFSLFPTFAPLTGWMLAVAMLLMPVQIIYTQLESLLVALDNIKLYNRMRLIQRIIYPLLVMMFWLSGRISAPLVFLSSYIAALIPFLIALRFCLRSCHSKLSADMKLLFSMLPYSLKTYLSCLFAYLVFRSDILMLKFFCGESLTGIYSVASSLADVLLIITSSVSVIQIPELIRQPNDAARFAYNRKILKTLSLIMLGAIGIASLLCGWGISLLYGKEYGGAVAVFRILMPGVFFWGMSSVLSGMFSALNSLNVTIVAPAIACVTNIILNLVLIPRYGINGAAVASSIAYFINTVIRGMWYIKIKRRTINNATLEE